MSKSVAGGIAVARRAGSVALAETVRTAFVHAMDVMLWVCGGIALAAAVLALAFLSRQVPAETVTDEVRTADEIGV